MESVQVNESDSVSTFYDRCIQMCGVCPSCVFFPIPPGSTRSLWKVSDEFERTFVMELLFRCRNVEELKSIQRSLSITSWIRFTCSRPRGSPQDSSGCSHRKPPGVDMNQIWTWFCSSPGWMKSSYLLRILSMCDFELLRILSTLTSVVFETQEECCLQSDVSNHKSKQHEEDPEQTDVTPVSGSSKSISGVSYRDFLRYLPVNLSKRILGLLDERSLHHCEKVCRYWQHLAKETAEEICFRRAFKHQNEIIMKSCHSVNILNPTYANIVGVPVPLNDNEKEDLHPAVQLVKPFEAAYAKIKTKTVQMEERNIYCGAYFTKVLLNKEYRHRVLDYRGGSLMAATSKNHLVQLLQVASETKTVAVLKEHVRAICAVLLCEERDLLLTAGCDATIRCWNVKTHRCDMVLCGHTGTINCLDVHGDRLVSGAKDHTVRVWSLHTWSPVKDLDFNHHSSVLCVKINRTSVYSCCDQGLIKMWDMKSASLLRVIDAHRSSVKCLFINEWHLLSGASDGKVMAWSVSCEAKERLMTFNHPKGVKSLSLLHLRVVTGCLDGKIRIFNFLTGDCLRDIPISGSGCLLSLHLQDHSILVNTTSSVQLFQFAKVFWDYTARTQEDSGDVGAQEGGKCPHTSTGRCDMTLNTPTNVDSNSLKAKRKEFLHQTRFLSTPAEPEAKGKNACEQMKKRGLRHPIRDTNLLRAEVDIHLERNARLRDSRCPQIRQDQPRFVMHADKQNLQIQVKNDRRRPETCLPALKHPVNVKAQSREVSTAPDATKRHGLTVRTHTAGGD